jgi:hypothetical protein
MTTPLNTPEIESRQESSGSPAAGMDGQRTPEKKGVKRVLYLSGRPTLKRFLRSGGKALDAEPEGTLVDEWHAARDVVRTLEKEESGWADHPEIVQLGPEYEHLLIEFLKDPIQRASFNTVPTEIALVELDRLVVYQKHIDLTFVEQLESELGPVPDRERVFRACLPYDHPQPPVKCSRVDSDSYMFVSPSNDLRFLGAVRLTKEQLSDCPPLGDIVGVVGLAVGFGSNFMNAIYAENRLILNNGSHRAYTLRKMGFTHAPCIVQHVPSRDALEVVASHEVRSNIDLYLRHPRPPMLRDYLNPLVHKVFSFPRRLQQITVRFEVSERDVPAF